MHIDKYYMVGIGNRKNEKRNMKRVSESNPFPLLLLSLSPF